MNSNDADEVPPSSEEKAETARRAVEVVMRDVEAVVGSEAMTVVTGTPEQLSIALREHGIGHDSRPEISGWVFPAGSGAIGIFVTDFEPWDDTVVRVAEVIQEAVIEGGQHWGMAFPPCPRHPSHPLDPYVIGGLASWVCPLRAPVQIPIGSFGETAR